MHTHTVCGHMEVRGQPTHCGVLSTPGESPGLGARVLACWAPLPALLAASLRWRRRWNGRAHLSCGHRVPTPGKTEFYDSLSPAFFLQKINLLKQTNRPWTWKVLSVSHMVKAAITLGQKKKKKEFTPRTFQTQEEHHTQPLGDREEPSQWRPSGSLGSRGPSLLATELDQGPGAADTWGCQLLAGRREQLHEQLGFLKQVSASLFWSCKVLWGTSESLYQRPREPPPRGFGYASFSLRVNGIKWSLMASSGELDPFNTKHRLPNP